LRNKQKGLVALVRVCKKWHQTINYDNSVFQTLLTFLCMYSTKVLVNSIVHTAVKQSLSSHPSGIHKSN
jgi:hypothetical protein